jgi:hypothetical protein
MSVKKVKSTIEEYRDKLQAKKKGQRLEALEKKLNS